MSNVLIREEAGSEYIEALRWYKERSKGAANGFQVEFARALRMIGTNPEWHPRCDERHRFYVMKRYPFPVIFRPLGDDWLVVAIAHTSREPGYWSER